MDDERETIGMNFRIERKLYNLFTRYLRSNDDKLLNFIRPIILTILESEEGIFTKKEQEYIEKLAQAEWEKDKVELENKDKINKRS